MKKYSAVVIYSIKREGSRRGFLTVIHYDDINISNEKIIELADQKMTENSNFFHFTIESEGSIHSRDKLN
ncbi:hypothetical protein ABN763_10070 [Spongiivirga sp. MCCC 1A20706]|uniref:hypothetical protein n=1 Tax=Spongiivirga sp. MCCC 1A20706 TaxID=3160963 RepID=UPI0039779289